MIFQNETQGRGLPVRPILAGAFQLVLILGTHAAIDE